MVRVIATTRRGDGSAPSRRFVLVLVVVLVLDRAVFHPTLRSTDELFFAYIPWFGTAIRVAAPYRGRGRGRF